MDWCKELTMEFLDMYEGEPVLWKPRHQYHKDRNQVYDAWRRIASNISMDCSLKELKIKKQHLMSTYRKLASKVKISTRTGAGSNEIYKPEWFAYDKMASFLQTVYTPRATTTSEGPNIEAHKSGTAFKYTNRLESYDVHDVSIDDEMREDDTDASETIEFNQSGSQIRRKRKGENLRDLAKQMDEAYHILKKVTFKPKVPKDQSQIFSELICRQLRDLDDNDRAVAMSEINNYMFNFKNRKKQHPNMPFYHYAQKYHYLPNYGQSGDGMIHLPPAYRPIVNTSYLHPVPTHSYSSNSEHSLSDNQSEVDSQNVGHSFLPNFNS